MRIIAASKTDLLDTHTGEVFDSLNLERLLITSPGGVIAGSHLYSLLAPLGSEIRGDEGWTMTINQQRKRGNPLADPMRRISGNLYITRLTYRRPKIQKGKRRFRPPTIKWLCLELPLFMENPPIDLTEITDVTESLIELAERRGVKVRPSPGSFGAALLRASPEYGKRRPAPEFISEIAREHLPGNFYALSPMAKKRLPHVYYMDQESSHHKIASSIAIPHPHNLRARGYFRNVEQGIYSAWCDNPEQLWRHVGLLGCVVECATLPKSMLHLYPPWAQERGKHFRWIWTPELRLFKDDRRLWLRHICCGLTSTVIDTAIWEYAEWSLKQRERNDKNIFKSTLLAAYGMLASKKEPFNLFTVHGRKRPPRAITVELPLLPTVYRSEIQSRKTPSMQNVVARGVIEAETRTRSLEYAKKLESEGYPVAQIYADAVLVAAEQMPLLIPEHWRLSKSLTRVTSPHPNSILSDQMVKLPGIVGSSQERYLRNFPAGVQREHFAARLMSQKI